MGLMDTYHYYVSELGDPVTRKWPLVGSPVPLLILSAMYLYFVLSWGPKYMKHRKPYSFKTFVRFYNVFQVFVNALIVYKIFDYGWYQDIGLFCKMTPYEYAQEPYGLELSAVTWWTLCVKIVDYIETILFVLRKKDKQISFLHVYHHISTVWLAWIVVKYYPTGLSMFFMVLNCSVHVIMYTYYFLSSYGPSVQRYTNPVKPFITIVQMVQFWILIVFSLQAYIPSCEGWGFLATVMLFNLFLNFFLFFDFYRKSYKKDKKKK